MVKLTDEMKNDMKNTRLFPMATSSGSGEPNVAPMGMVILQDDSETIWIIDNFMQKSLKNINENGKIALYVWYPEIKGSFQIKGTATSESSGADFEKAKILADKIRAGSNAKSLVKMKITEVYSVQPGPTAGKKLL
ncbi:MAG: pyridoxamine 5'-phosphate oxidase family protein [Methanomassiliicoccaceae archaeon]|nr:pyridoxamine 5'-phosphate oxidase family protein [Methanomassiliicoccaceae archaeon]